MEKSPTSSLGFQVGRSARWLTSAFSDSVMGVPTRPPLRGREAGSLVVDCLVVAAPGGAAWGAVLAGEGSAAGSMIRDTTANRVDVFIRVGLSRRGSER